VALALAGMISLLWLLGGSTPSAHADPGTLYVAPDGNDANNCDSEANRCATIQRAVDVASLSDVILVATGVYTGVHGHPAPPGYLNPPASGIITQVVYISKTVTIGGGYATTNWTTPYPITQPTTLDAQEQGRVIFITGDISPTIEGLRITDGDAAGLGGEWGDDAGGGVYVISTTSTIRNNQVFNNNADLGGGLCLYKSDATLSGNTVTANTAEYGGGGLFLLYSDATLSGNTVTANEESYADGHGGGLRLWLSDATLSGNTVASNTAGWGGGLYLYKSDATLSGNTVISNTANDDGGGLFLEDSDATLSATLSGNTVISNTADRSGGGLCLYGDATLSGNTFASNTAGDCGGLYLYDSDGTLSGNTVISNTAGWGGGLCLYGDAMLSGNTFAFNTADRSGGGLSLSGDATLSGNTIISNIANDDGGGLYLGESDATLTNTVVTDNQANTAGSGLYIHNSSPRLLHTTIARNSGGDGSGVHVAAGSVALTNTILVSHTVGITVAAGNTATLESTLWYGNATDWALFDADGYHLMEGSEAIDKGVDAGVMTDIDGDSRDSPPDLGADELAGIGTDVYLPIILKNASP
jgi:parallel beta-helix repeat protein